MFEAQPRKQDIYGDKLVTSVYQLRKNISAKTAVASLKGLISPIGTITAIPQAQAVVISDTQERIGNIIDVIRSIERLGSKWDFELYELEQADAEKVTKVLDDMFNELKKRGELLEGMPLLTAVPWSNSILVSGTTEQKKNIKSFLGTIDRIDEEDKGIIRVYKLQNAESDSVSKVLQSLLEAQIKQQKKNKDSKVNDTDIFKVSSDTKTNSIVVLSSNDIFPQVEKIIAELDAPLDQVYVEVLVMETTLTNSRRFGVEWMVGGGDSNNLGQLGFLDSSSSLISYASPAIEGDTPNYAALPGGFSLGVLGNTITFGDNRFPTVNALVNFSRSIDEINILSTPQIMTLDHSEAEVFVGENRPYVTSEKFDSNNNPIQTYDYRDVGIKLKITPHINRDNDLIRLDLYQEIKKLKSSDPTTDQPTTLNRYTKTSVQILDGSTVVISGMVQDDNQRGKTGIPGLASIPVLGWLFKAEADSFEKSTIMVFLTARVVHTLERAEQLTEAKQSLIDEQRKSADKRYEEEFTWDGDDESEGTGDAEETGTAQ